MGVISKGDIRGGGKKRPGRACQHCDILILNTLQNNLSRFMKFKGNYMNARNLGSANKFAFGGDINRAKCYLMRGAI